MLVALANLRTFSWAQPTIYAVQMLSKRLRSATKIAMLAKP